MYIFLLAFLFHSIYSSPFHLNCLTLQSGHASRRTTSRQRLWPQRLHHEPHTRQREDNLVAMQQELSAEVSGVRFLILLTILSDSETIFLNIIRITTHASQFFFLSNKIVKRQTFLIWLKRRTLVTTYLAMTHNTYYKKLFNSKLFLQHSTIKVSTRPWQLSWSIGSQCRGYSTWREIWCRSTV